MKSSTKKYFNSEKRFNKRIKKQASSLPTAVQTTTMQTTANQPAAQQNLEQTAAQQIAEIQNQLAVEEQRKQAEQAKREADAQTAISTAASQVPSIVKTVAKEGGEEAAKRFATTGSGLAKSSTAVAPIALGATVLGEGLKYFGGDDDPTTYNVAETSGGLLSGAGKGASYGALAGSIIPGVGNIVGAGVGAAVGLGVNAAKMLLDRKEAREQEEKEKASQMQRDFMFGQRAQELFGQAFTTQGRDLGYNVGQSVANSLPAFQREAGGKKVPGGVIKPLPFGAVEFKGNKHGESGKGSSSGIILEEGGKSSPGVEVEDGETMDKIKFSNGKEDDYIFSSYLKLGGKSFAQMHKEILQSGGDQRQIQNLAKMQEEKAKEVKKTPVGPTDQYGPRGQEYIAKYGGVRKKFQAGMGPIAGRQSNYNSSIVRPIEEVAAYHKAMGNDSFWYMFKPYNLKDFFKDEVVEFPKTFQQLDSAKYSVPLNIPQPTPQPKQFGGRMKAQASVSPADSTYNTLNNVLDAVDAGAIQPGTYTAEEAQAQDAAANAAASRTAATSTPTGRGLTPENTPNLPAGMAWFDNGDGTWSIIPSVEVPVAEVAAERDLMPYDDKNLMQEVENEDESELPTAPPPFKFTPPKVRDVPPLAYLGTAAQLLGPLAALRTSYPEASQKISAGVQGLKKLGRVNFNAERAANINSSTAANRFIQNSTAGPAAIAAMIASNNKARQQSNELASQEARVNMQLSNAENQINANIVAQNMARDLQAQGLNTEDENLRNRLEYTKTIDAFNAAGDIGSQLAFDVMQYKAAEREARANQIAGEYTRNQYVEAMQNRPKYRKMLREAGVNPKDTRAVQRIAAAMYNPNMSLEEQEETFRDIMIQMQKEKKEERERKRYGGYIGKYGSVKSKAKK